MHWQHKAKPVEQVSVGDKWPQHPVMGQKRQAQGPAGDLLGYQGKAGSTAAIELQWLQRPCCARLPKTVGIFDRTH